MSTVYIEITIKITIIIQNIGLVNRNIVFITPKYRLSKTYQLNNSKFLFVSLTLYFKLKNQNLEIVLKSLFQDKKSRYFELLKYKFRVTKSIFRDIK